MTDAHTFFATAARGLEPLIARELTRLGATSVKELGGGVSFTGDVAVAYRACLWTRLASRILLPLSRFPLEGEDATEPLYQAALKVDWPEIFDAGSTFAIEVAGHAPSISHTHYAGLKVKDAIVDTFRAKTGSRPSVDTDNPNLRIHLHLHKLHATLSLDLSGASLHRRGYRRAVVNAPLKENLAATILLRAGWPELAAQNAPLLDPMCGSGTLVIEAALMAADVAPGLMRERFGFEAWRGHQPEVWRELLADAHARADAGLARELPPLLGTDVDATAIRNARDNAKRAGLAEKVRFETSDLTLARPFGDRAGLVVANPPYGERMGEEAEVIKLHSLLGSVLKQHFGGWQAAVFTGRPDLGPRIGLRARDLYSLFNGPLPCKLLLFDIPGVAAVAGAIEKDIRSPALAPGAAAGVIEKDLSSLALAPGAAAGAPAASRIGGADFANRLNKNLKHLGKWAKRADVSCYRAYDADLPDYAVAVDVYESAERHIHVQEYAAPKTVDPSKAEKRLREALGHIQQIFEVPVSRLHYKLRKSQKGDAQYRKQAETGNFHEIVESGCKLWVNFEDYLDSGLFLDHRALRLRIQKESAGKRFLNLFCYTGSATAHAARGGAAQTVSIDLSNTYLDWAQQNLKLNGFNSTIGDGRAPPPGARHRPNSRACGNEHALLRADCLVWLAEQADLPQPPQFDLILCDPPTFSNSKRMEGVLDIQRDHAAIIRQSAALLAPDGVLYFSTNRRSFKLDNAALEGLKSSDITAQTLDEDFKRLPPPPPHRCWRIQNA